MGAILDKPVTDKETEAGAANGLRHASSSMQGYRPEMEDRHLLVGSVPSCPNMSVFGVFDGHGGSLTADLASENILHFLTDRKEFQFYASLPAQSLRDHPIGMDILQAALTGAFLELDADIRNRPERYYVCAKDGSAKVDSSGCTACLVLVTPRYVLCANAGDSRAIMRTGGQTVQLSFDHKPHHDPEQDRIERAGGYVSMKRVDGDLGVSRGLGDFRYKDSEDLPPSEQKVSCVPEFVLRQRSERDEFVVVACDGVWDVVSCEQCSRMVQDIWDEGEEDIGLVCEEILDQCLEKETKDNVTALVVAMAGLKVGEGEGVAGRRAERQAILEAEEERKRELEREKEKLQMEANEVRQRLLERARREEEESDSD